MVASAKPALKFLQKINIFINNKNQINYFNYQIAAILVQHKPKTFLNYEK